MSPRNREKFTVAIICALALEAEAAEAYFDEVYDRFGTLYGKSKADRNCYLNGRVGKHETVMCYMPGMGKGSAAMVSSDLRHSYPNIEIALVLGICGGVPKSPNGQPIFLGDVIIGDSIIPYDYGKQYPDGFRQKHDVKNILGGLSHGLRTLLTGLSVGQARRDFQDQMAEHHRRIQQADSRWHRPQSDDVLFDSQYPHKHHTKSDSTYCVCFVGNTSDQICDDATRNDCASLGCEQGRISRRRQQTERNNAAVYIGKIASADRVMKSASHRDKLAEAEEVIAFEMESAGVCDNFPCIVIKGVSDYADSHKDSKWQLYAAANAAAAAKTLLEYLDPIAQKVRSSQWMVPFRRNPKFVGRQKEIEHLRALISDPNGPRELAITGLGGVGKTQVALEIAYQIRDDAPDWSIFWIPCTSLESVEQAYTEITRRLGLSGGDDAKKEVQTYFSQPTSGNWLFIFDNADDETIWFKKDNALQAFIAENEHGRTLFTSRNQQLALDLTDSNVVPLPEYDINTGLEFLQQSLQENDLLQDHDTAVQLLEQLMLLPLAITQAVAYINKNQITLPTYIGLLERQESDIIEVLSENFKDKWRYKDIQNPVATTWWISFQQIQQSNQLAAGYLTFMACINPRNIPQCMLPPSNSENDKIKAIGLLKSYAFVSDCEPRQYGLLSIHRLVHIATRNWMRSQRIFGSQMIKALGILDKALSHPHVLIPEMRRLYLPHVLKVLREESVRGKQTDHGTLIGAMSETLYYDMRYKEAEELCTHFIQNIDTPNFDDEGIWHTVTILASICRLQRFSETGRRVATQFLDSAKTIALQNISCLSLRAISYLNLQQDDEANKAILAVIERLGPEHPATMDFQASIAVTYRILKRYGDSEKTFLQVIETAKSTLGPNHFSTIRYQTCLARLYSESGQYNEAENICLCVMETSKTSVHLCCYHKLDYQFNLGLIYADQKRYREAEEIMIRVIASKQQVRGPKTTDIIMCFLSLALLYVQWQRIDKAEEALMRLDEYRQNWPDFIIGSLVQLTIASIRKVICVEKRLTHEEKKQVDFEERLIYMGKKVADVDDKLIRMGKKGAGFHEKSIHIGKKGSGLDEESIHRGNKEENLGEKLIYMVNEGADYNEILIFMEKIAVDLDEKLTDLEKSKADLDERLAHLEKETADLDEELAHLDEKLAFLGIKL